MTVHRGRVETLDLPAASFDGAILIQTIEHLPDPRDRARARSGGC